MVDAVVVVVGVGVAAVGVAATTGRSTCPRAILSGLVFPFLVFGKLNQRLLAWGCSFSHHYRPHTTARHVSPACYGMCVCVSVGNGIEVHTPRWVCCVVVCWQR